MDEFQPILVSKMNEPGSRFFWRKLWKDCLQKRIRNPLGRGFVKTCSRIWIRDYITVSRFLEFKRITKWKGFRHPCLCRSEWGGTQMLLPPQTREWEEEKTLSHELDSFSLFGAFLFQSTPFLVKKKTDEEKCMSFSCTMGTILKYASEKVMRKKLFCSFFRCVMHTRCICVYLFIYQST